MTSLKVMIRARVIAQSFHQPKKVSSLLARKDVVDQAWWLYGKFGYSARTIDNSRFPIKRILREGGIKMPFANANRIFSITTIAKLHPILQKSVVDEELINYLKEIGRSDKSTIGQALGISSKKLDYRLRKEIKNWNIIKVNEFYWYWQAYFSNQQIDRPKLSIELLEEIIQEILRIYPLLTVDQICFLTGIKPMDLSRPMSKLTRSGKILRGITRKESPDEYFVLKNYSLEEQTAWSEIPIFVLDHRDPLVELIKLERFFSYNDAEYWLFIDGIPQAEFNLRRLQKSRSHRIHSFHRLMDSDYSLSDLLDHLSKWASNIGLQLRIDFADDNNSQLAIQLVDLLYQRGYSFVDNELVLQLNKSIKTKNQVKWFHLGGWYRHIQYFNTITSTDELIKTLVQVEDPISISLRTDIPMNAIVYTNILYVTGINYRLGLIHQDNLADITAGWPKDANLNTLDQQILKFVQFPISTQELCQQINRQEREIIHRLRFLELNRFIRRDLLTSPNFLEISNSSWVHFNYGISKINKRKIPTKQAPRSYGSIAKILLKLLDIHIPLTIRQITRILGITVDQFDSIKTELLRSGKLLEGYFIDGLDVIQISTPSTIDSIQRYHEQINKLTSNGSSNNKNVVVDKNEVSYSIDIAETSDELCSSNLEITNLNNQEIDQETNQKTDQETDQEFEESIQDINIDASKLEEENYLPSSMRLDVVPGNDYLAQLHLSDLMLSDNSLLQTKRTPPNTKYYMLMWDGIPFGYCLVLPSQVALLDYELELKIKPNMLTNPVISATLERLVSIFRGWNNDEIRLSLINDLKPSNTKFELLHFMFESIGLDIL